MTALGALSFLLSGCLSDGYAYYNHKSGDATELYFKLPSGWKVFGDAQVIEAVNGKLSPSQLATIENGAWAIYFAGSQRVRLKQVTLAGARVPEGEAFAHQLSPSDADALSLQALREQFLQTDPFQQSDPPYHVISYSQFTWPGGIRGSKMVVNITGNGGLVTTFGQVVAVDPQTSWIFGIGVGCRASCWGPDSSQLNQIFNSWTVKELAR